MKKMEEPKLTCLQICNELRLTGYNRSVVEVRFIDTVATKQEWVDMLTKIGIDL